MDTDWTGPCGDVLARTVVTGPLAPYAAGWRAELAARGFAPHSITAHAQLMAQMSGWRAATGRSGDALTDEVIERVVAGVVAALARDLGGRLRN